MSGRSPPGQRKSLIYSLTHYQTLCIFKNIKERQKQAGAEPGQAQLKLELIFTLFKICCPKLINKDTTVHFDPH